MVAGEASVRSGVAVRRLSSHTGTVSSMRTLLWHVLWLLDEALDRIPGYEAGRWYKYGCWGCRLTYRFPALRYWDWE